MDRIISFLRSELFLSLAGGFALGLAGMVLVKPASADIGMHAGRAITVGALTYETIKLTP